MKNNVTASLNEKIKSIHSLIKDFKRHYNILEEYFAKRKELKLEYELGNISREEYDTKLEEINKKIFELESKIYINLGKIKQNLFLLKEEIIKDREIKEEFRQEIIDNLKNIVYPILEYPSKDQKIYSEILKIEETLNKIEKIPEISIIEKFEPRKVERQEENYIKDLYKIKKKLKKEKLKIDLYKIFIEVSDFIFGKISNYILDKNPNIHYNLRKILFKGKINISPSKFLSTILFSLFLISTIILILFITLFEFSILIIFLIFIILIPILFYIYITYRTVQIRRNIDLNLPFASIHILSMLQTGLDVENCFRLISETENYGYLSLEFKRLADLLNTGISLSDAIEHVRDTTVSERFKEFLDELLLTLRSGRSIKEFFLIYTENQLMLYRTDLEKINQAMKTFSDLYIGLVLTIPMLLISVGIMMSTISSTILGLSISEFLNVLSLIVLPVINIGVIIFISKLEI